MNIINTMLSVVFCANVTSNLVAADAQNVANGNIIKITNLAGRSFMIPISAEGNTAREIEALYRSAAGLTRNDDYARVIWSDGKSRGDLEDKKHYAYGELSKLSFHAMQNRY